MNGRCTLAICGLDEGLACEDGHVDFAECPHFKQVDDKPIAPESAVESTVEGQRLPWTGRALGLSDMMLATVRSAPTLIGLIGPFNAGKTAFLTSLFVHFSQTGVVGPMNFAGSYTLQAWSRLRQHTSWPATNGPAFPPHTPDSAERVPSLLHLAFREGAQSVRDVLFTDAPGEWFARWIQNQSAENSQGAQWIAEHSTHFLFFVDRGALAGPQVGQVRHDTLVLARVLSEQRRGRPIIAVWAKSDMPCDLEVEGPIREKLTKFFGEHPSFDVHVEDPASLKVLALLLQPEEAMPLDLMPYSIKHSSAFLAYRASFE